MVTSTSPRSFLPRTSMPPPAGLASRAFANRSANRCDNSAAVPRTSGSGGTSSWIRTSVPRPSTSVRAISMAPSRTAVKSTLSPGRSRRRRARSCRRATVAAAPSTTRTSESRPRRAGSNRGSARRVAMRSAMTLSEWFRSCARPEATTPIACMRCSCRRVSRSRSRWASRRTSSVASCASITTTGPVAVRIRSKRSPMAWSLRSKRLERVPSRPRDRSRASAAAS